VIAIGTIALRLQFISLPFMGFMMLCNMMLQTIGAGFRATILAVSRSGLFLIPCLLLLASIWGLPGLEASQLTADMLAFALTVPIYVGVRRSMKRMWQEADSQKKGLEPSG